MHTTRTDESAGGEGGVMCYGNIVGVHVVVTGCNRGTRGKIMPKLPYPSEGCSSRAFFFVNYVIFTVLFIGLSI